MSRIRKVEACFFEEVEETNSVGLATGKIQYLFHINSQDRDPVCFTTKEYKRLQKAQEDYPTGVIDHSLKRRSWWWFDNEFYSTPLEAEAEDVLAFLQRNTCTREGSEPVRPVDSLSFLCVCCGKRGNVPTPLKELIIRCPQCRSEMRVWLDESGQLRTIIAKIGTNHSIPQDLSDMCPWTVLSVKRGASLEEIRNAYRSRIMEYHPDRVAHLGYELRELAERKAKQINWAYKELC